MKMPGKCLCKDRGKCGKCTRIFTAALTNEKLMNLRIYLASMQCNKENYQVASSTHPLPSSLPLLLPPLCVCLLLYLNAFHFYVAELEQTHSRVRKASQVKRESSGSSELHREITLTMSSALEVPYLASPFLLSLSPSFPLLCCLSWHCMLAPLKGFWGHNCAAFRCCRCCCLLFFYHLKST